MPRRPTSPPTSRHRLHDRLDDVDPTDVDAAELRPLTLAEVLNCEIETVDEERGIVRLVESGELRRQAARGAA